MKTGTRYPTYASLAAMTKLIEGAVFVGKKQYDAEAYGYLFARGQDFVLAVNTYYRYPQCASRSGRVDRGSNGALEGHDG